MSEQPTSVTIREAQEDDVVAIAGLYRACYGDDYPFVEFYDHAWIKRGVYDSGIRWYVAVADDLGGRLLGSAAIMLNAGDADDQVSEIGRLVVHPDGRGRDLATQLVERVVRDADELSDFAFAECRSAHAGSQVIFHRLGFHVVGAEPLAYELGAYETVFFVCRLSEGARVLRRGAPLVAPEVYELACHALHNCGIEVDVRVSPDARPHPVERERDDLVLEDMQSRQHYRLLRMGRQHFLDPDVFGSFRLEHGNLKLKQHAARYLVLRSGEAVVAGIGFTWDDVDRKVKVFELVAADARYKGTLLERAIAHIEAELDPRYIALDVNAHATATQASLVRLGFAPCVYAPSMVYVMGERFDVVKMVKLRQEPRLDHWVVIDAMRRAAVLVKDAVWDTARGSTVDRITRELSLFRGLRDADVRTLGARCRELSYAPGEVVFGEGTQEQALFVVIEGAVQIERRAEDGSAEPVATIGERGVFGEMALVEQLPRSATARATAPSRLLVLSPRDFDAFVQERPEAGVVVLRNLAVVLSERLRKTSVAPPAG
ncbi:MAG: GNAT family N-acetyltransferase [Polyangiales bacterium]|nr:GNAT family N-acetyltransferase [Myxococcales bacterium]